MFKTPVPDVGASVPVEYHQILAKIVFVSEFKFPYKRSFFAVSEHFYDDPDSLSSVYLHDLAHVCSLR